MTDDRPPAEVVVALDVPEAADALAMVDRLGDAGTFYKVGLELYTAGGGAVVRALRDRGKRVFLDLKLHDIPNTVAGAVGAAAQQDVDLLTLHVSGGERMLRAAVEAGAGRVRLLGVTLLTSLSPAELETVWGRSILSVRDEVERLAGLASESGLDGVVCSVLEAPAVRRRHADGFLVVTPGIRLAGGSAHDQQRVATPAVAVESGADHLVVGRTVTEAADPAAALRRVLDEVEAAGSRVP